MRKKIGLLVVIVFFNFILFAEDSIQQFYGTHAFIKLPSSYEYNNISASNYIKNDFSIVFNAFRDLSPVSELANQISTAQLQTIILPNTKNIVYVSQNKLPNGKSIQTFLLYFGDDNETTVVNGLILNSDNYQQNEKEIIDLLDTVYIDKTSELKFNKAIFYRDIELHNLEPISIMGDRIVYTPMGLPTKNSNNIYYIGRTVINQNVEGYEKEVTEQLLNADPSNSSFKINNMIKVTIDNMPGYTVKMQNNKIVKYNTFLFSKNTIYFINANYSNTTNDDAFVEYTSIVNSFKK